MLIDLNPANKILEESLRDRFAGSLDKSQSKVADFDGVTYKISSPDAKTALHISMSLKCFPELQKYGADSVLKRIYGDQLQDTPEDGYDVTLRLDLENLPEDKESLIREVSLLKRNALAAPFERAFAAQLEGNDSELMTITYRADEAFYVKAQHDRVTVIFSTVFTEETDRIFGKVFLQEFVDARRSPATQNAPQVLYSHREPPMELRGVSGVHESENIGYITFVLFPRHFTGKDAAEGCISRIQLFRDYLHYHIKASKAYMHSRMRTRVGSFLKVLNRAKPEQPEDKEKKTSSGKTFKRS
ncbi:Arp2/3 complex, 34 kd subunit p34-Arc-domain-containing protein [Fimicolochytrium jonesii]|uniref:Arp2/3 complex, 34 kd subunit p34-Arc-domain-containing protein n=1 Tax=Fimicolochytrium jonesii TaxID=1396493 RepID=UPI0022FDF1A3|nr:Arp2/3 complex, 34 kd subunit p34-Arc-domain-containing protein [Fimicolochytrium jonesii]KAI8818105.1 Arp2/3 complex, 34 kd subunit p34-Arc-domain-containing protein [Fimicolochytrium jonesii]